MEKINTIISEGVYFAKLEGKSYIVLIKGKAPFLNIVAIINFTEFISSGMIEDGHFQLQNLYNHLSSVEWFKFDYINTIEEKIVQQKANIKNPYTEKQFSQWIKTFNEKGEEKTAIQIMNEMDYPLEFVQTDIIPRIKRIENENA